MNRTTSEIRAESAPATRRRYERRACALPATLKSGRLGRKTAAELIEISQTGARVRVPGGSSLRAGSRVSVLVERPLWAGAAHGSGPCRLTGTVLRRESSVRGGARLALRFDRLLDEQIEDGRERLRRWAALAGAAALLAAIGALKAGPVRDFWYDPALNAYGLLAGAFVLSRFLISACYREPEDRGYLPKVSMIMAAYNEGPGISASVEACLGSRYPEDRRELIVVDDGSTDRTWDALFRLQERFPSLKLVRLPANQGKRAALAAGIRESDGEVLVFVDSDGVPEPEALYRLVQPLADRGVGAVAGHVDVALDLSSTISKMESVRYHLAHRLMKACESVFGAVSCCPGPFSAYRRRAVLRVLDSWLEQRFLGTKATFGDDRSLTLRVLKGWRVVYHSGARCLTPAPARWSVFLRQQLRWKRSWLRELPFAAGFMWREHPIAALSFYAAAFLTLVSPPVLLWSGLLRPALGGPFPAAYLLGFLATYLALSLLCFYRTRNREWPYGLAFAAFYMLFLVWMNYYALLTIRRGAWGTR